MDTNEREYLLPEEEVPMLVEVTFTLTRTYKKMAVLMPDKDIDDIIKDIEADVDWDSPDSESLDYDYDDQGEADETDCRELPH